MAHGTSLQPPSYSNEIKVAFPQEHVILLTLNRPKSLNAITPTMTADIKAVLDWFDNEPSLWIAIITGEGRAFCAGADLVAWNKRQASGGAESDQQSIIDNVDGFASVSRRYSTCKPIIAAVNGGAYGGGVETILNCDLVVASENAKFALPEVKRGVVAVQGGMPRLSRTAGHQLASEMLLLGKTITAKDAAKRFGFVNKVVPQGEVLSTALAWAAEINANSPDAVQSTKRALLLASRNGSIEDAVVAHIKSKESKRAFTSENIQEGLQAFIQKRKPSWKNPAKL
ncbi:enoyl-CoA hydratase/carnithine racemase [Trametes versicolor FP-101664 SS1]|uniref:enoyl-CoA hydratase/carnithine racemase n=1 Tax=Trametes versicolor (strain FP-101664) TaxID=717944 RepID=UPI00046249C3|nr:enoyl-CoA hydratase/carnithine racemase [Trametes versicolor FP-101664 SS1]EIW64019.1 enoyl-CoA hydratase/carnithine racemase [Trametes versicolor FP-101664 SS1]